MVNAETELLLRELVDEQHITEALYTYFRAVDRIDRELGY